MLRRSVSAVPSPGAVGAALAAAAIAAAGGVVARAAPAAPDQLSAVVVRSFPHDRLAFTEGLVLDGDRLFESTGLYGHSELREVDRRTGRVLRRRALPKQHFGEGLALVGKRLWFLTYQEGVAHRFDRDTFRPLGRRSYPGEGWGLCYDGARLVQSDGSDRLTFRDPDTFAELGRLSVTVAGGAGLEPGPVEHLNELECVDGVVYANVWQTDRIVRIDPRSGRVTAVVDASGLLTAKQARGVDVQNGIAYDSRRGTFLLTGKYWPRLFEVRFRRTRSRSRRATRAS